MENKLAPTLDGNPAPVDTYGKLSHYLQGFIHLMQFFLLHKNIDIVGWWIFQWRPPSPQQKDVRRGHWKGGQNQPMAATEVLRAPALLLAFAGSGICATKTWDAFFC